MLYHWRGLGRAVSDLLASAEDHVLIVAPFVSPQVLRSVLPPTASATVVTSWRGDHLRSGYSSLETYDICQEHGRAALYINDHIHAKIYARDLGAPRHALLIGSANLTQRALDDRADSNIELLVADSNMSIVNRIAVQAMVASSTLVTDDVHLSYRRWLAQVERVDTVPESGPDFVPRSEPFLVTDLPLSDSPSRLWTVLQGEVELEWWEEDAAVHDVAQYRAALGGGKDAFLDSLKSSFFSEPFVHALVRRVDQDGLYFGQMKAWIQGACLDVPTPRRRELTRTLRALLRWITELAPGDFEVTRPRHSECLRRR